jgi:hypothetical protein
MRHYDTWRIRTNGTVSRAAARARGKTGGRKPLHADEPRVRMAYTMSADQRLTVPDICCTLRISPATFYRYVALGRRAAEAM